MTHNKKLNEELDLCFGRLNSCVDNLCYKKFAEQITMDLDIPNQLARNFCLIGTCFYTIIQVCILLPNCTNTKKLLLIAYQLLVLIFDLCNCKWDETQVKQNWCTNCMYRVLVFTNHNTNWIFFSLTLSFAWMFNLEFDMQ